MSYEDKISKEFAEHGKLPPKLGMSTMKYLWQINPIFGNEEKSIPKFLRKMSVLKNFSDRELHIFANFLHRRNFSQDEIIFRQNDLGIGFYLIFSGRVDVVIKDEEQKENELKYILSLEKGEYFGELALLQESGVRSATLIAKETTELLGIFKPDMDELMRVYPLVATKLLQAIAMIIANRLYSITKEVSNLKYKISQLEKIADGRSKQ